MKTAKELFEVTKAAQQRYEEEQAAIKRKAQQELQRCLEKILSAFDSSSHSAALACQTAVNVFETRSSNDPLIEMLRRALNAHGYAVDLRMHHDDDGARVYTVVASWGDA